MNARWVPIPRFLYERLLGLAKGAGHNIERILAHRRATFPFEFPTDSEGHGWDRITHRDAVVEGALRNARGMSQVEAALRDVKHREFVVSLDLLGVTHVSASHLLPRSVADLPRIVTGNVDVSVPFPKDVRVVVLTHNHAAMTPLSAGDVAAAIKNRVREVRAVVESGVWRLRLVGPTEMPDAELSALALGLALLREVAVADALSKMPPGTTIDMKAGGGDVLTQIGERHVNDWNRRLGDALRKSWGPVLKKAGVNARLEFVLREVRGPARRFTPGHG